MQPSEKTHVVQLADRWLERSNLSIKQVLARVQAYGCDVSKDYFDNRFRRLDVHPDISPELTLAIVSAFTEGLSQRERCTPAEAVEFAKLTRLPIDRFTEMTDYFPEGELAEALANYVPNGVAKHQTAQPEATTKPESQTSSELAESEETEDITSTLNSTESEAAIQKPYNGILYKQPGNLRRPQVELVGRAEIISKAEADLDANRHVLLAGYGGVGKTAIAATIADSWIEAGKGYVLWLEANYEDSASLFEALVAPLGEQDVLVSFQGDAKIQKVREILTTHNVGLVVLDNLQQATLFREVREATKGITPLLVTSWQSRINIDTCIVISRLVVEEAINLLASHAANASYNTSTYRADSDAKTLCQKLGCHPLLIVIAGTQLKAFQRLPDYLLMRLDSILTLEIAPEFAETGRQTMQAVFDQTMEVLTNQKHQRQKQSVRLTQTILRVFGALRYPSATDDFLTACIGKEVIDTEVRQVEDALDELVIWNLLERPYTGYYVMHDMVHAYARDHLYHKSKQPTQKKMTKAIQQYTNIKSSAFDRLQRNLPNIIQVAETTADDQICLSIIASLALEGYQDSQGHQLNYLNLLDRSLAFLQREDQKGYLNEEDQQTLHHLLCKRGNAYFDRNEYEKAAEVYQYALDYAYNEEREVMTLSLLGKTYAFNDDDRSEQYFSKAESRARKTLDKGLLSFTLEQIVHSVGHQKDFQTARRVAAEQVIMNRELIQTQPVDEIYIRLLRSLTNLGTAELYYGQRPISEIVTIFFEAQQIAEKLQNKELQAQVFLALAEVYQVSGNTDKFLQSLQKAEYLYKKQGRLYYLQIIQELRQNHENDQSKI